MTARTVSAVCKWSDVTTPTAYHEALMVYLSHCRYIPPNENPENDPRNWDPDLLIILRAVALRIHTSPPQAFVPIKIENAIVKSGKTTVSFEEFIHAENPDGTRTLLATATTTMVLVNKRTMRTQGFPDGVSAVVKEPTQYALKSFARPKIPTKVPTDAFRHRFIVRNSDIDFIGHVTNARYIAFFDDALIAGQLAGKFKHGPEDVTELEVAFEREVRPMQEVEVECWFEEELSAYVFVLKRSDGIVGAKGVLNVEGKDSNDQAKL